MSLLIRFITADIQADYNMFIGGHGDATGIYQAG